MNIRKLPKKQAGITLYLYISGATDFKDFEKMTGVKIQDAWNSLKVEEREQYMWAAHSFRSFVFGVDKNGQNEY